jgi:hypothetical protein
MKRFRLNAACLIFLAATPALPQTDPGARAAPPVAPQSENPSNMQKVMDRLDQLEREDQKLLDEIRQLRTELKEMTAQPAAANSPPDTEERLEVQESRTAELAQSKVEASQRMPLSLTGMLLFNAFQNGRYSGSGLNDPVTAALTAGPRLSGATLRQTILGLRFNGPDLIGGGKVSGTLYMDFFGGSVTPNNNLVRLRIATLDLAWKNTTITIGQDKPIVSPREPTSLAQMGVSPLTGAGNLWNWSPQAHIEQRFSFGESSGLRVQAGVYQTAENQSSSVYAPNVSYTPERARPGYQTRIEYFHGTDSPNSRRFEIAPGFHISETHVEGASIPSRVFTLDGMVRPVPAIEITGAFYRGENVSVLGALRQGFTVLPSDVINPVHATGGWGQITLFPAARGSFHFYAGEERDRPSDLIGAAITSNFVYAGNFVYKLAPNVLAAIELSQVRTTWLNTGVRLNNHYDLALAYLF